MNEASELRAIVDNWLVVNTSVLLTEGLPYPPTVEEYSEYHPDVGNYRHYHLYAIGEGSSDFRTFADAANYWQRQICDSVTSLLHLLDVVVLYDKIEYNASWSSGWVNNPALKPLCSILHPIDDINDCNSEDDEDDDPAFAAYKSKGQMLELLGRSWEYEEYLTPVELAYFNEEKPKPDMVRDGAIYYFNLARALGAHYWPAPPRAEFLAAEMARYAASTIVSSLQGIINKSLDQIVRQALVPLEPASKTYTFPGFGSLVLADCKDRSEVIQKAIAYRNSDTARAFRSWLVQLEYALMAGDVTVINKSLDDLRNILEDFKIGKLSVDDILGEAELKLGLAPTLTLRSDLIKPLLRRFKQKPKHVVFLRTHLDHVLKNANLWYQVQRLFPETFDA
jgi:hypothetical protein